MGASFRAHPALAVAPGVPVLLVAVVIEDLIMRGLPHGENRTMLLGKSPDGGQLPMHPKGSQRAPWPVLTSRSIGGSMHRGRRSAQRGRKAQPVGSASRLGTRPGIEVSRSFFWLPSTGIERSKPLVYGCSGS